MYEYDALDFVPRKRYFITNSTDSGVSVELSNQYCFHVNTTQELTRDYYEIRWRQDGKHINIRSNPKYNSTVLTKQNGELIFTIEISNVSADDLGDYIGAVAGSRYTNRWCNGYSFLYYSHREFSLPTAVSYSSLEIYSKCICNPHTCIVLAYQSCMHIWT